MPIVTIVTNLPKSKITNEFISKTSKLSAELTRRPESAIELVIQPDQIISFAGSQDPAAFMSVGGIDCVKEENRGTITKAFHELLVTELGIDSGRFYILFKPIQSTEVAFKGRLYAEILAGK